MKALFPLLFFVGTFLSPGGIDEFEVRKFDPLSNFPAGTDTVEVRVDLSDAVFDGIAIPSGATEGRHLIFSFEIKNNTPYPQEFFYKIFYQNESYKFLEYLEDDCGKRYNPRAGENFYGSWEDTGIEFKSTGYLNSDGLFHTITDSFRIVGNPRNEQKYLGSDMAGNSITVERIREAMEQIRQEPEWMAHIQEKAVQNKVPLEEQLYLDAIWTINRDIRTGDTNNRWKRNPRMGDYSFILVVCTRDNLVKLPEYVKNIGKTNEKGDWINPYDYLLYREDPPGEGISVLRSGRTLRSYASFDLHSGIYVDFLKLKKSSYSDASFSEMCGNSDTLFRKAQFEQFFHTIDRDYPIHNIPVVANVVTGPYTLKDYERNRKRYTRNKPKAAYYSTTSCPCSTVGHDPGSGALFIKNPGNPDGPQKKENTGLQTRIGFTYGKFCGKIEFPFLLNEDNIWNGVTCAFWLIFQDEGEWNSRSSCDSLGYIPKSEKEGYGTRISSSSYSEIDIEIVKSSRHWPPTSYNGPVIPQSDEPGKNPNLVIACSNWDLACPDPEDFSVGVSPVSFEGQEFYLHRWSHWYKALTSKYEIPADEITGTAVFFEIDWQPERIIWRAGTDENEMKVIGYMDSGVTMIPDNQMVLVITQEFHPSEWWPTAPFRQEFIPYPGDDITGRIYEISVK